MRYHHQKTNQIGSRSIEKIFIKKIIYKNSFQNFFTNRLNELANETCIVQIGSNIHKINLPDELQKKGLVISSIDDALKNYTDIIQKTLESTNSNEDKYTALNNAAFNSGIFIYIPRNLILEKAMHIVSSLSVDGASTISRNVIVTEDNSKASIIQELYAPKTSHQQAYLELLNVSVGQNSQLDGTTLQIMDNSAVNFSTRKSNIAQDGKINWYLGLFGAMLSRYRLHYYLGVLFYWTREQNLTLFQVLRYLLMM